MKENFVAFISEKIKKEFNSLSEGKFEDKKLYKYILRAIDDLKQNPLSGTKIPKELWPEKYIQDYKITNLWKYDLPNAWRLIYTLETDEVKIISFILEWFNHKGYEKRFSY
jgi:Txe/YoeB family toxin of Txe-Axe toxin-antitoxin module